MTVHGSTPISSLPSSSSPRPHTSPPYKPWKVYPKEHWEELKSIHGQDKVKLLHFVRHAEGTHNVDENYRDPSNIDARLTDKGKQQCAALAEQQRLLLLLRLQTNKDNDKDNTNNDICVWTSPMTRCVQTALYSFPHLDNDQKVPFVAHESWRETVNYNCDRRRTIAEISCEFSRVDFGLCDQDHDFIWTDYRNQQRVPNDWDSALESVELHVVAARALIAFQRLQERPESEMIVCSHSAFLRCILNWGQEGGVPRLMEQCLDERDDKTNHKLFEYHARSQHDSSGGSTSDSFEEYMRSDYDNCELRSFCFLVQQQD